MTPRYRQLKPRPGRSGERVAEHQRRRLHAATIDLVDEGGYDALTVAAVVKAAGVSKHTFYENFRDKQDCFIATHRVIVRQTAREVLSARNRESGWRARLRSGLVAVLEAMAKQPRAARLVLVAAPNAGAPVGQARLHTDRLFARLLADSFAEIDDGVVVPPALLRAKIAGISAVARARLLRGREAELPDAADALIDWALSLRSEIASELCQPRRLGRRPESRPARPRTGSLVGSRNEMLGDERTMILSAAAQLATDGDCPALTVSRIRTTAGVARRHFDDHFSSVTDCLLALLELLTARLLANAEAAYASTDCWRLGIHRGVVRVCEVLARNPWLLRLTLLEPPIPGVQVERWRTSFVSELACMLTGAAPARERPNRMAAEASAAAMLASIAHYAAIGRGDQLRGHAGTLSYLSLAPLVGAEAAGSVIRAAARP